MAAITINAIALGSDAVTELVQFGAAASVGDAVYFRTSTGKWEKADAASTASAETAGESGVGINLSEVVNADDYGMILVGGTAYINSGITKGNTYCVGTTGAGDIEDDAAVDTAGGFKTWLFLCTSAATGTHQEVVVKPLASGVTSS